MTSLLDTGFLYALIDSTDEHYEAVLSAMQSYRGRILFPVPAITEATFLISSRLGVYAMAQFLESLETFDYELVVPEIGDYLRSADILRKYNDQNIDFVDACIVAIAERLNITKILTIDRRHFSVFKPLHCDSFELLPE